MDDWQDEAEEWKESDVFYIVKMLKNSLSRSIVYIIVCVTVIFYVSTTMNDFNFYKHFKEKHLPPQDTVKEINYDFKMELGILNSLHARDDNSQLIGLIRNYFIENPSVFPYNLNEPKTKDPSQGQAGVIDKLLNEKGKGFFVDCGANDGEGFSNSLFLERHRGWNGILIEANPTVYKNLKKKNRKSYTLNACLNTKPYPSLVTFLEDSWWGKIFEGNHSRSYRGIGGKGRFVQVQCFPLYSILLALNQTRVDYFSLDVEGAEQGVLDSIPWEKVDIKTMSIEYNKWSGGKLALTTYMKNRGYKAITEIKASASADVIFMKEHNIQ